MYYCRRQVTLLGQVKGTVKRVMLFKETYKSNKDIRLSVVCWNGMKRGVERKYQIKVKEYVFEAEQSEVPGVDV